MVNEAVALFIPLLLAVVSSLSAFVRGNIDLRSAVEGNRPSFPFFLRWLPSLGRFTAIHLANISLLLLGIIIIKDLSEDGFAALVGALIIGIFILILPIIEIKEYGSILSENRSGWFHPKSYYYFISMIFLSLSFFGFVEMQALIINWVVSNGGTIGGNVIFWMNRILEFLLYPSLIFGIGFLYASLANLRKEVSHLND